MSRPIDADALLEKLSDKNAILLSALIEEQRTTAFYVYFKVVDAIEKMPTIDAVPVAHGHWAIVYGDERERLHVFECSVCKMHTGSGEGFNYCPFCGAKMDEKWWEKNGEVTT